MLPYCAIWQASILLFRRAADGAAAAGTRAGSENGREDDMAEQDNLQALSQRVARVEQWIYRLFIILIVACIAFAVILIVR